MSDTPTATVEIPQQARDKARELGWEDGLIERALAKTSAKVASDGDRFKFNTAVAALMILVNELEVLEIVPKEGVKQLMIMLAPFAPHLAEHLWEKLGGGGSVHQQPWPAADLAAAEEAEVVVQVAGRKRGSIHISPSAEEAEALAEAVKIPAVAAALGGSAPKRVVYVPGRILNLVV